MARSKPSDATAPSGKAGRGPASSGRGRSTSAGRSGSTASGKGKDGQPKVGRIKRFGNQLRMIKQAYTLTHRNDRKLPWIMLAWFVGVAGVIEGLGVWAGAPFLAIPLAVLSGALAALTVFGRRAQGSAYRQVEGQPGAAAWVLEGLRGQWEVTSGVAATPQMDAVHRVLGRPGVLLVAEGAPTRVGRLLAQEKKKIARLVGDAPIYDIVIGDGEGQVPLRKLSTHVMKLPRNLSAAEVNALTRRLSALGGPKMPVPGGPLPGGRAMTVSQRQVRRRG